LPVKEPQQLVLLTMKGKYYGSNWGGNAISYPMYHDFKDHNEVFSGMFCRFPLQVSITFGGQSELADAELVSGTYFDVLGVGAAAGTLFTPEVDRVANGAPVAVLSYDYWKTRFAMDKQIVGKTLTVNAHVLTVIGVAQAGFDGVELGHTSRIFIPVMMEPQMMPLNDDMLTNRRNRWVNAFGRLKPGVTREEAKASLQPFMHSMLEMEVKEAAFSHASAYAREGFLKCWIDVLPGSQGRSYAREDLGTPLWLLMASTGMVLLIACANIANLLLAKATGRQKEIAVRLAIGAGRGQIVGQLLVETLLLAGMGGLIGLVIAYWADNALMAIYLPDTSHMKLATLPDMRILLFTFGVAVVTGLIFGLVPALQTTKPNIGRTLKDEAGAVVGGGHTLLRKSLVVTQVALSLLLLIGAGLFLRSLTNLRNLGPGFSAERLVGFEIDPSLGGYSSDRAKTFYQELTSNLSALPGVQSVGLATMRILEGNEWDSGMTVEGYTAPKPGEHAQPFMNSISPNYFATMGIPILEGRDFRVTDNQSVLQNANKESLTPLVAIINEKFAQKYFPGRSPVGMHIGFGTDPGTKTPMEVIGVVKDVKYTNLRDEIQEQAFVPYLASRYVGGMTVYLRTAADPKQVMNDARRVVHDMDANLPVYAMRTEETQIDNSLTTERMIASLCSIFGFLATLLAMIGLYGVMAYVVAQRTREIGIRMALGAVQSNVVWMVMREVLMLVAIGVIVGVPASIGLAKLAQSQLFGLSGHDPLTVVLAAIFLAIVACGAGYVPAWRASKLDPITALRYE
jgi:predicted permease